MQRTFVAIALALTLSCACATYISTQNYTKALVGVVSDNETAFTNSTYLLLDGVNTGEIDILATGYTPVVNTTNVTWNTIYRKIDGKALTATGNTTLNFTGPDSHPLYFNGYVVSVSIQDNNGTKQVTVAQKSISGGNTLAPVYLSANTDVNSTPEVVNYATIGKNVYIFFQTNTNSSQVNVSSFTAGTTTKGTNFNLTTAYSGNLSVAWGEALGNNQLYANWNEGPANASVLRYATIDVSKGTVTANTTAAYLSNYNCRAYATDKKWYGDFCSVVNAVTVTVVTNSTTNETKNITYDVINYYVRFNETKLIPFNPVVNGTLFPNTSNASVVFPYAAGIAVIYSDKVTVAGNTSYSYELWNLDTLKTTKNKTTFLTTDYVTQFYRIPSAGVYSLTYQIQLTNPNISRYSTVQVGQFLSGSYLTSVLGFIMTIVAGVLLF